MKIETTIGYQLDEIDRRIVHLLTDNVKSSLAVISKDVGVSTTAVHQRIKKLENAGVVENSISFLNPQKIGYKVISFIGIFLEKPSELDSAVKALKDINEVVEAHQTTGDYSVFVKILSKDNNHLKEILGKIQKIKSVSKTETFISLDQSIGRQLKV